MRIGWFLGSGLTAPTMAALVDEAVAAERDGFDSFWLAQTFGPEILAVLAMAGQKTKRIELGTAVVPTFPRHPMVLAQEALTAQGASNGRLTLGIGLSHKVTIEDALGLSFAHPAKHMREYLTIVKAIINEGGIDFTGEMYRVNGKVKVPGATPCPVLVAALGRAMLKVAGELADGTVTWMVGTRTLKTHIIPRIAESTKAAGRPAPRIAVGVPVAVTNDPEAMRERMSGDLWIYGRLPSYQKMLEAEGAARPVDVAAVGDEAAVERGLRAYAAAGATDLLVMPFPLGTDDTAAAARQRTRAFARSLVGKL
jgi:F420-dependent oxidoreductase-like protein